MTTDGLDILTTAETWLKNGHRIALATVMTTWGSAPRPAGSQMVVRDDGAFEGSVSGGCVEKSVIETALEAMTDGRLRRMPIGVADAEAWSAGIPCGGRIEILLEPLEAPALAELSALTAALQNDRRIVRAVDLHSGQSCFLDARDCSTPLDAAAEQALRSGTPVLCDDNGISWLLLPFSPPVDLVIVGAVHIAQALSAMARLIGHRVRIIDPRTAFATVERFPDLTLCHDYPDEAFARIPLGCRSAVVTLSHDAKIDDPALVAALASEAFYIGALGSRKTQAARRERLREKGFSEEQLARLHGPVGLAIGAKTPEEIAVSILAELTAALRLPA